MKPHTPAATDTTNSFDANHKANHCHAKHALAACQPAQKSFQNVNSSGWQLPWRLSVRFRDKGYDMTQNAKITLSSFYEIIMNIYILYTYNRCL